MFKNLFAPKPAEVDTRTPEQIKWDKLRVELFHGPAMHDYVLANVGEDGNVRIPVEGTMTHLFAIQQFLAEGATLNDIDMIQYQDTSDYSEVLLGEIKQLIMGRITNGYAGEGFDNGYDNSPYEATQRICGRFLVGLRGFTVTTTAGQRISTVADWTW